ncbi:zf-DHHC-domain-containing protein [Viridothelium virens]|uniref:Palmitoyltransferase n=1 Tax=Viridothelium virens TaxID=1048519 RepID=A0A6A6H275_VIRVR|nr:zf-DHHC-domain-containing protein [Viridothelium virens]
MQAVRDELAARRKIQVNNAAARFIPVFLIGIVGYVTWVVAVLISVHFYLDPSQGSARNGAGITILVLHFLLLAFLALNYFRLFHVLFTNNGFVPHRGQKPSSKSEANLETQTYHRSCAPTATARQSEGPDHGKTFLDFASILDGTKPPPPGTEEFYSRDIFVCDAQGLPIWCPTCANWKPDRTHHCSDVGRCVRKLDHFCPWVGGVVSETNFKFFIQFNLFAAIFSTYVLIVCAYSFADNKRLHHPTNTFWVVALGLSAFFAFFTFGMFLNSTHLAMKNLTTVEAIDKRHRTYFLAIALSRQPEESLSSTTTPSQVQTITYPLFPKSSTNSSPENNEKNMESTRSQSKTFAIIQTSPGDNPWDLGPYENFKNVMGDRWWDWLLPLRYSPLCDHKSSISEFPFGPVVDSLKKEYGMIPAGSKVRTRRRRRT